MFKALNMHVPDNQIKIKRFLGSILQQKFDKI